MSWFKKEEKVFTEEDKLIETFSLRELYEYFKNKKFKSGIEFVSFMAKHADKIYAAEKMYSPPPVAPQAQEDPRDWRSSNYDPALNNRRFIPGHKETQAQDRVEIPVATDGLGRVYGYG